MKKTVNVFLLLKKIIGKTINNQTKST